MTLFFKTSFSIFFICLTLDQKIKSEGKWILPTRAQFWPQNRGFKQENISKLLLGFFITLYDYRIKLDGQNSHHLTDISICLRFYNLPIEQVFLMTHLQPDMLEAYMDWSRDGGRVDSKTYFCKPKTIYFRI